MKDPASVNLIQASIHCVCLNCADHNRAVLEQWREEIIEHATRDLRDQLTDLRFADARGKL